MNLWKGNHVNSPLQQGWVVEERTADVVYVDFSKTFDTTHPKIFRNRLREHEQGKETLMSFQKLRVTLKSSISEIK